MSEQTTTMRAKPRKSEKIAWIIVVVLVLLFIIFEISGRYQLDATKGLLILLVFAIILLVLLREKPAWNAHDAIEHVRVERYRYQKENLDPMKAEVQPAGKHWIVDFSGNAFAFTVDPNKRRTIGMRVKTADEILAQIEKSEALKNAFSQDLKDQKTEEALSALGYDQDDINTEENNDE